MPAGARVRAFDHIELGPIVLEEIEIDGGEIRERIAEIPNHGDGFQEDFGKHDGRADIEIDAAVMKVFDERAQQAEIVVRGAPQGLAARARVRMRSIGSDGDVDRDGCRVAIGLAQQAGGGEAGIGNRLEMTAERLAEALLTVEGRVKFPASLFSGSKAAVRKHGFHVLAGLSGNGDFEIVNRGGAVQCKRGRVASAHEIDQDRAPGRT